MDAWRFRNPSLSARYWVPMAGLLLLGPTGSRGATSDAVTKVPEGVILVKGAWSSASDSTTPLPEGGKVTHREYTSPYFHLSYPVTADWTQKFDGPPPSDNGYYVLAQIQS